MRVIDVKDAKLHERSVADPDPSPREIVIQVAAAGINRADLLQAAGHYPPPVGAPSWPGLEVSGWVSAIGQEVTGWAVGDRVAALLPGGGYAEYVSIDAGLAWAVPPEMSLPQAAALTEAACTAWSNLVDVGGLAFFPSDDDAHPESPTAPQRVLVHGGSGGVGHVAVQLAKAAGAWVATTAGSAERAQWCVDELGVDLAIDYKAKSFADQLADDGVDVVLDVLGAGGLADNVRVLATGGRLIVIGLQKGARGELNIGALLSKRASVHGTTLRSRPLAERQAIVAAVAEHVVPLVADGRLSVHVSHEFDMADAAAAHEAMAAGEILGKAVLVMEPETVGNVVDNQPGLTLGSTKLPTLAGGVGATKWEQMIAANPGHSDWYIQRFAQMAAEGADLAGEARLIDAMADRGARILDAGCGPGRVGLELAGRGHHVVGVDVDPALIAEAERVTPEGVDATWLTGDLAGLDLPDYQGDAGFDLIVCAGNVLTFLAPGTERDVLHAFARHLAPGGRAVVGFGAGRGYEFADFLSDVAASGLTPALLASTWNLHPFTLSGSDFLVAILTR